MSKELVVVTGLLGSGKTTLSRKLVERDGFEGLSIGDELEHLCRLYYGLSSDMPVSGLDRMDVHKLVRGRDPGYFSRFLLKNLTGPRVIDGLRNLDDARAIQKQANVRFISLVAPRAIRFSRRMDLDLSKDASLEKMAQREIQELNDPDPDGAQTLGVMTLSESHGVYIDASQDPETVYEQVKEALAS